MADLSRRGRSLVEQAPMSPYFAAHKARRDDPDYIGLCIAENKLVWDLLRNRLTAPRTSLPHTAICYDDWQGSLGFRESLSRFMARTFLGRQFDAEQIAVLAGAGSVLEILFHAIADPGDAVLVPTPSYAGFWADLETRDQLRIVTVHTRSDQGFALTEDLLDAATDSCDRPVRALLFTNPDNPMGKVADADQLRSVVDWTRRRGIHLVVDEIYALSVFGDQPFASIASVLSSLGDSIHVVWAFSKDFGASGLRCGVLITENEALMEAVGALGYWSLVSGDTQHLLKEMIEDDLWVDGYVRGMQDALRRAYTAVSSELDSHRIGYVPASGGFFLLVDFRPFLAEPTWEAEDALWRRFVEVTNVNLTPGSACRIGEPGFMRLCFAAAPTEKAVEAVGRIARVVGSS